jgi:hypothetical protein
MLTFIICTLLVLFILSLNICEGDFLLSLQITGILALGVSLLFVIFFVHWARFACLLGIINHDYAVSNAGYCASLSLILSTIATAIYTIVGIRKLYGN